MDEIFTYAALSDTPPPAIASFDGGTGNDTLDAGWIGSDKAGDGILTEFTLNPDGSFSARYYDLRGNSVTITGIENVHIHAVNGYYETPGGDLIREGGYQDVVITGRGDDVIFTDTGVDLVNAGSGINAIDGGGDDDFISVDLSAVPTNILWNLVTNTYSGPGSYTNLEYFVEVTTGSGNDTIVSGGPDGPTSSVTGAGPGVIGVDELISTGGGNDSVTVLQGNDTVNLGAGRDRISIDYRDGAFNGNMTFSITQTSAATYSGSMVTTQNGGVDGVTFTEAEDFTVRTDDSGGNGFNSVDTITTGDGNDVVFTFHSNDLIHVGLGVDQVDGGTGVDGLTKSFSLIDAAINFNLLANTYSGPGSFANIEYFIDLRATNGDDVIVTGLANVPGSTRGNDTIFTLGGNDTVTLSEDDDTVDLGEGDDRLILDYSVSSAQGATTLAISGTDTYSGTFNGRYPNDAQVTFAGVEHFTVRTVEASGSVDTVTTGNGNDIVFTYLGADIIAAGAGNDVIDGGAGNDRVDAGAGQDTVTGGDNNDSLTGGSGTDLVSYLDAVAGVTVNLALTTAQVTGRGTDTLAGFENLQGSDFGDRLTGTGGVNSVFGGSGNDTINAGGGADGSYGGAGDDIFFVDNAADLVVEAVGGGTDLVAASVDYTLGAGAAVETLRTTSNGGTGALNLTGNGFAQSIFGNAGANVLSDGGGAGVDTLTGAAGNDTYVVRNAGTQISDSTGTDRVAAGVSFTLGSGDAIEVLTTTSSSGTTAINLTGNSLIQSLFGNAGANRINGGAGSDTLTGGAGADRFVFNAPTGSTNVDTITDFSVAADTIEVLRSGFAGLAAGVLAVSAFRLNATGVAGDASDRVIYNSATGDLWFDADGTGGASRIRFADLDTGLALTNADIFAV